MKCSTLYYMERKRPVISITVDPKLLKIIDSKVDEKVFHNRSHAFEFAILQLMKNEELKNQAEQDA